jgi:hypothetical protein
MGQARTVPGLTATPHDSTHLPEGHRERIARALFQPRPSRQIHRSPLGGAGIACALEAGQGGTFGGIQFAHMAYLGQS